MKKIIKAIILALWDVIKFFVGVGTIMLVVILAIKFWKTALILIAVVAFTLLAFSHYHDNRHNK